MSMDTTMDPQQSAAYAKKYLEDILSFFGINADVQVISIPEPDAVNDVIELSIPSSDVSGFLIGRGGETLRSLQSVTASALRVHGAQIDRISIDIAGYKKQRADRLAEQVDAWARRVLETGKDYNLDPMNAVDRRTVHRVVDAIDGLTTHSEGEGRDRHIVISRAE